MKEKVLFGKYLAISKHIKVYLNSKSTLKILLQQNQWAPTRSLNWTWVITSEDTNFDAWHVKLKKKHESNKLMQFFERRSFKKLLNDGQNFTFLNFTCVVPPSGMRLLVKKVSDKTRTSPKNWVCGKKDCVSQKKKRGYKKLNKRNFCFEDLLPLFLEETRNFPQRKKRIPVLKQWRRMTKVKHQST